MTEKLDNTKTYSIIMGILFLFMLITKLYKLGSAHEAIYVDEAGLMYNVKALIDSGVDISNATYPVYPNNFDSGQSALYTYMCVIISKIFGVSLFTLRLPAVIFSLITYYFGLNIVKELYEDDKKVNVIYTMIFATVPYFFLSSRIALDCNLMLGMSTIVVWTVIKIFKTGMIKYYVMLGISGGITLYTYAISHIAIPIFLCLVLMLGIKKKVVTLKGFLCAFIPMIVIAGPLIVFHIINQLGMDSVVIGPMTIPVLSDYRGTAFSSYDRPIILRIAKIIVCIFLSDGRTMDGYFPYFTFYIFSWLFGCLGFVKVLGDVYKRRNVEKAVVLFFTISILLTMLTLSDLECCTIYRMNSIFICFTVFVLEGIIVIFNRSITTKKIVCISLLYGVSFLFFMVSYYNMNPKAADDAHLYGKLYPNVIDYLTENNTENKDVVFIDNIDEAHIYFYLSAEVKPEDIKERVSVKKFTYKGVNYYFEKYSDYEKDSIYILESRYKNEAELLKEKGYSVVNVDDYHVCIR